MWAVLSLLLWAQAATTAEADRLYAAGRYEEAAAHYRKFLEAFPNEPPLLLRMGGCELALGRLEDSVKTFSKAVRIAPDLQQAQSGLGAALLRLGKSKEAIPPLTKATDLDPSDRDAKRLLARAYQDDGQWIAAEKIYRVLVDSDPRDTQSWYHLGMLLYDNTYIEAALEALEKAVQLDPANATAQVYRATALAELGRTAGAQAAFARLAQDPEAAHDPEFLLGQAQLLFRTGRKEEALAGIEEALRQLPKEPKLHYWKARIVFSLDKPAAARPGAELAVQLAPELPNSRFLLLKIYRALGLKEEAAAVAAWLREYEKKTKHGRPR